MQKDVAVDFMVIPNVVPISFVVLFFVLDILQFHHYFNQIFRIYFKSNILYDPQMGSNIAKLLPIKTSRN